MIEFCSDEPQVLTDTSYRGRSDIHENWKKVQLGKKEIDKLHSRGIPYVQAGLRGTTIANPMEQNH